MSKWRDLLGGTTQQPEVAQSMEQQNLPAVSRVDEFARRIQEPLVNGKDEGHAGGYQIWVKVPPALAQIVPDLDISLEFITPERAVDMLTRNTHNRPLNVRRVAVYAKEMTEGRWEFNGETITFDWNGVLLDGQQRLSGIDKSKIGVWSVVVRGLPPHVFDTIDTGSAKTTANMLAMDDVKNSVVSAAMARMILVYDKYDKTFGTHWESAGPDANEVTRFARTHPEFARSVNVGLTFAKLGQTSIAACCHHLFSRDHQALADQFFKDVANPDGVRSNSPAHHLRERLQDNRANPKSKLDRRYLLAIFFKAWLSYRAGKPMKMLRWAMEDGPNSEPFPLL